MDEPRAITTADPDTVSALGRELAMGGAPVAAVAPLDDQSGDAQVAVDGADAVFRAAADLIRRYQKNDDPRPLDDDLHDSFGLPTH
jgi:hypothetical protein